MSTIGGDLPYMSLARGAAPPLLSAGFAVGACTLFTVSYVGGLYLSPTTRVGSTRARDERGEPLDRNHPRVIRARMIVASLSTLLSVVSTAVILAKYVPNQTSSWWLFRALNSVRLIGLPLPTPSFLTSNTLPFDPPLSKYLLWLVRQIVAPLGLTSGLFAGPLYVAYLFRHLPFQSHFNFHTDVVDKFTELSGLRNYVVGPLTEEVVFRGCILPLLFFAGVGSRALIFASPLFFGVAHVHHAYSVYVEGGRTKTALHKGLVTALVQFAYTGVFGWYADFLFLRSASILPPLTAHVLCNLMGLPNPWQAAHYFPKKRTAIFAAHVLGIAVFVRGLIPLTSPHILGAKSLYWS